MGVYRLSIPFEVHLLSKVQSFEMEMLEGLPLSASRAFIFHCIATKDSQEILETSDLAGHLNRPSPGVGGAALSGFALGHTSLQWEVWSPKAQTVVLLDHHQVLLVHKSGFCCFLGSCERLSVAAQKCHWWALLLPDWLTPLRAQGRQN